MNENPIILTYLAFAVFLIIVKIRVHGIKDLLVPLALFYFYFAFGPIINFIAGVPIYFGTPQEYIPDATLIFVVALGSLIVVSFVLPPPKVLQLSKSYPLVMLKPVFVLSMGYALWVVVTTLTSGGDLSKVQKISIISPGIHYSYLMIQIYLTSFFFLVRKTSVWKFYVGNFALYLLYGLTVGERDFIFPLISIMTHHYVINGKSGIKNLLKLGLGAVALTLVGIGIFFFRDSNQAYMDIYSAMLNQGSLLFINTFTLKLLHERVDHFFGLTYVNSFLNLLPSWIYKTDFNTLDWFKNQYAAASDSGYGFGLDAEGFLNFSYFGVVITFAGIAVLQRMIIRRIGKHPFFVFFSVFYLAFTMYSLRNDSLAFTKGHFYGVIFFFGIYFSSRFLQSEDTR